MVQNMHFYYFESFCRSFSGNKIKFIPGGIFQKAPNLTLLELKGNPIITIDPNAFSNLPNLKKL